MRKLNVFTILCLNTPGLQKQIFKHVPKFKWFPFTNTCYVNFVGTIILLRIPQQANDASFSGFCRCNWNKQNVNEIRK